MDEHEHVLRTAAKCSQFASYGPGVFEAVSKLRDPSNFQWYLVPLGVMVLHLYAAEAERRNWRQIFAGLALWGMDWFNEVLNALFLHFSGYSAPWVVVGPTGFQILVGLNIEICLFFAFVGLSCSKFLPANKALKVFGIPNRLFVAMVLSAICVLVEMVLNFVGVLVWNYSWWHPLLIWLVGYLHFFVVAFWVHDLSTPKNQVLAVAFIFSVDIAMLAVFMGYLRWV